MAKFAERFHPDDSVGTPTASITTRTISTCTLRFAPHSRAVRRLQDGTDSARDTRTK